MGVALNAEIRETNGISYVVFPLLESIGVAHAFSTRMGGVSTGEWAKMNFGFTRGEDARRVRENYRRMGAVLGFSRQEMVLSRQTHGDEVLPVDFEDAGDGVMGIATLSADALITDCPGLLLVKHFADCTPVYLADPVDLRVCAVHAGWRGTVQNITGKAVRAMVERGSKLENIYAAVGPAIGVCCFEVDEPVAAPFRALPEGVVVDEAGKKPHVDLWQTNRSQLLKAGVQAEHIAMANLCTSCDEKHFYSHRRDKGHTGTLASFIGFKK